MKDLEGIPATLKSQLTFTCAQEKDRIPPRDPQAEQLYVHARWLLKGNILAQDPAVNPPVERLLRIATAYGHDKANIELRQLLQTGKASSVSRLTEVIDLTQSLIARGIPSGYYAMGWYVERGYGVEQNPELALQYYRKSADLGSPEGQYLVGDKLSDESIYGPEIGKIGWDMLRCAAQQNHAQAAYSFGIYLKLTKRPIEAMKYYQIAAAVGDPSGASSLSDAFSAKDHADPVWGLAQAVDAERQDRYHKMFYFLSNYSYLNPKVPEIDQIVPLPPAKLPAWDGKFKWREAHEANLPPPLPSPERINEMAKTKGLDPKTGQSLKTGG